MATSIDGLTLGPALGKRDGDTLGTTLGLADGPAVGDANGDALGLEVGPFVAQQQRPPSLSACASVSARSLRPIPPPLGAGTALPPPDAQA